jgi:glycerate 2-kinase
MNRRARRLCLDAFEAAFRATDPEKAVETWLRMERGTVQIGNVRTPIDSEIRVVAVGKASAPMLSASLRILGEHVVSGILVSPRNSSLKLTDRRIATFHPNHPTPDQEGVRASGRVLATIEAMRANEVLLCLISGGASAMLPAPAADITLEDKRRVTRQLIHSRASIHQINTVRRHLSELKGGRLVERCGAGMIVSLIISDVSGNALTDIASGMTSVDPTSFRDAVSVLEEFNLWKSAPRRVRNHLKQGLTGKIPETPKPSNRIFRKVHNFVVADNRTACEAARTVLQRKHVPTTIVTSSVDMEARSLGKLFASVARDSEQFGGPVNVPGALVFGGETTVEVRGNGEGGRNQEVVLSSVEGIGGLNGVAVAALGTDGVDGNSPAAGAISDPQTIVRAKRRDLRVHDFAERNVSYNFFRKLNDNICTGPTGTNVGDLYLLVRTR